MDELVPLCELINNTYIASKISANIKNKMSKRKRLLKAVKRDTSLKKSQVQHIYKIPF
jgi:hypothetical protein